jgi:hypothetical protein
VAVKEIAVKRYAVCLNDGGREQLNSMINKGKHPSRQVLKARILLKADASDASEGWSDGQIAGALDTSADTVARTRQRLVEEGVESALRRDHSPASARQRIFDGTAEGKSIALIRSRPPTGRARWTLRLLEDNVVELNIFERASDNTIGRTLKKHCQTAPEQAIRHSAGGQRGVRGEYGRCARCLSPSARSGVSRRMPGRNVEAIDRGNTGANPGRTWTGRTV